MRIYIANLFTGAHVQGAYTSLDKAKAAIGVHFAAFNVPYDPALWKDDFGNDRQHSYPVAGESHDGLITDTHIVSYDADVPLEMA